VGSVQRAWRQLSIGTAEAALAADPRSVAAWEWLIALRDPRNGAAPDASAHEQAIRRMVAALEGELGDRPLADGVAVTAGQVAWAARHEQARTVEDVLARHPGHPGATRMLDAVQRMR
jgi:glycerol-3-phosphate dehydrogenase